MSFIQYVCVYVCVVELNNHQKLQTNAMLKFQLVCQRKGIFFERERDEQQVPTTK